MFKVELINCKNCLNRSAMKGCDYCSTCNRKINVSYSTMFNYIQEDAKIRAENREKERKMRETMDNFNKKRKAEFHASAASDPTPRGEAPTPPAESSGVPPAPTRTAPTPMEREDEVALENNSRSRKEVQDLTEKVNKITDDFTNFAKITVERMNQFVDGHNQYINESQKNEERLREENSKLHKELQDVINSSIRFADKLRTKEEATANQIEELNKKFVILNDVFKAEREAKNKEIEALESQLSNEMRSNDKLEAKISVLAKGMTVLRDNIKSKNLQKTFDLTTDHKFEDNSLADRMERVEV